MVLLLLAVSTISFFSHCTPKEQAVVYLNHHDSVSYVGVAVCASCHPDQFETFRHTGMGQSFGQAKPGRSSADFHHAEVVDSSTGLHYRAFWKEQELYMAEYLLGLDEHTGKQDTIHYLEVKIDYIVGSGQHTNSHLFQVGEHVYQAPMTFYTQEQRWDLPPGFENGNNSRFKRIIDVECMSCHNAMPAMQEGSPWNFVSIGSGIDCERCHGPGSLHAQQRAQGKGPDQGEPDPTIIQPARLPLDRQMDLCQRCHLQGLNILQDGKEFTDFRPGMRLSEVFEVYLPRYAGGDGKLDMANHAARFQQSACMIHKDEQQAFNCISCHNPHISVTRTDRSRFNGVCADCHQNGGAWERGHSEDATDCVDCHMPQVASEDILHVAIHDHRIQVPTQMQTEDRELVGLYAVNEASPAKDRLLRAYLEYWEKFDKNPFYLQLAAQLLEEVDRPELHIKYHFLTEDHAEVMEWADRIEEADAWTSYMLGESAYGLGQEGVAEFHWKRSVRLDPERVEVGLKLGRLLIKRQKWDAAQQHLTGMKDRFPMDGMVEDALGELALRQGDLPRAADHLARALKLEPLAREVWENQLNLSIAYGHEKDVVYWSKRLLERWPDHPDRLRLAQWAK